MEKKEIELRSFVKSQVENSLELCKNSLLDVKHKRNAFLTIKRLIDDFVEYKNSKVQIFIMPGLRGVGKTTLLRQAFTYINSSLKIPIDKILLIDTRRLTEEYNSNLFELFNAYEKEVLEKSFESLKEPLFILIDEAHYDPKWDEAITVLTERSKKIFFIVTGSSALRLTTSDLERRSNVETIFPLNFQEYAILRYSIFPPKFSNTSKFLRIALFESDIDKAYDIFQSVWRNLSEKYFPKFSKGLDSEIKDFLTFGGFPFTLVDFSSLIRSVDALTRSLEQMIRSDVYPFVENIHSKDTKRYFAIIHCLIKSLGSPNSNSNIYESVKPLIYFKGQKRKLFSSDSLVYNVIDNLIKTKLIFPVKPFSAEEKMSNFAWKYYFATSTVPASMLIDMGRFTKEDNKMWGKLIENEVAASFEKNKQIGKIGPCFFDYKEESSDFIILNNQNEKRVFEVTFSKNKKHNQALNTMLRSKAKFGVIVGDYDSINKKGNILEIPYILLFMI